jgi:photosystem II stability/assembly factor-like uncharacterized protein
MLRHLRPIALGALFVSVAFAGRSLEGQTATTPVADEFERLHFRSIGPATMSGRISDLAVYDANPAVYYVGTAHGGVWKTTSNGALFEPQFQHEGLISIGDVTMSQTNPNLVWVGTGESNNRQTTSWGDGVYKSIDGGKTWRNMGLRQSRHINRIVIDPEDQNVVLVAATGPLFGPGGDRGVFKTTDGGATWRQVLKVDEDTGANDLVMASTDRRTLYASTYQRRRVQCCMNGGGPGSGIWKSTDGGENWTRLTGTGWPAGPLGRIAVDVYRRSANILYALVEGEAGGGRGDGGGAPDPAAAAAGRGGGAAGAGGAPAGGAAQAGGRGAPGGGGASGLYRSDDGGATWRRVSTANPRPMYFSQVRIDPSNPDRVYLGGVGLHMTNDAGQSMATDAALVIHDDIHAIWINPNNTDHLLIGGDGGVAVSYDMSRTWTQLPNLPLALFYHIGYDMEVPYNVCGGLQDNYNWCGPSQSRFVRGIANYDWFQIQGGDGFVAIPDPRDPRIIYTESQNGNMIRRNKVTGESKNIRPNTENAMPRPQTALRWNWDTPIVFSPHEPGILLVAAQRVFRSTDRGDSWTVISPDLTTNADRSEIVTMGLRGNQIRIAANDGISAWPTIVSLAESPKQPGLYYTGTDDGVVSVSRDGGKTWQNVTDKIPGFPRGAWVSEVVPSKFDAGTVYVTVDAHRLNDYNTYIWASNDFGATFRSLNANLRDEAVKTLTEDAKNADVLYIGTETGVFLTIDRGKSWRRLKANLPTVRVDEITIHPRDNALLLGTHGRGAFILDHLEPIQEYAAAQALSADAKLYTIPTALMWKTKDDRNDEFWGHQVFVGENPPNEAMIQLQVKRALTDVKLRITDATGKLVRELTVPPARLQPGIQTVCWDFRLQAIPPPAGAPTPEAAAAAAAGRGGRGGGGGGAAGGAQAPGGRGGGGVGPGGGMTGVPTPAPASGYLPMNPCGGDGGGGRGGGGGGGFGAGGGAAPHAAPGTYSVALVIDGKVADTKPLRVILDPAVKFTPETQEKRYFDITADLHELHRRATEAAGALNLLHGQMAAAATKLKELSNVPAGTKTQFDVVQKEFDAVRVKFGVPLQVGGGGGGFGGRGGGRGGGGGPGGPGAGETQAESQDLLERIGTVKGQISAIWETPSDALMKQYGDAKLALPKAVTEANALLIKAMALGQALKKHDITLTVPSPIK